MAQQSTLVIVIAGTDIPAQTVADRHIGDNLNKGRAIELLRDYLARLASGQAGSARVLTFLDSGDGTAGSNGKVACVQASIATGDTVVIGGVTFTVVASSPNADPGRGEFIKGADNTASAANLATAINAHPRLKGMLTALGSVGDCNLTMVDKGLHSQYMVMSKTGSGFTLTAFSNGAKGTPVKQLTCINRT